MEIIFNCKAEKNGPEFRDKLCEQLKGNPDFVESNIVVSDIEEHLIGLYISQNCTTDPTIHIDL